MTRTHYGKNWNGVKWQEAEQRKTAYQWQELKQTWDLDGSDAVQRCEKRLGPRKPTEERLDRNYHKELSQATTATSWYTSTATS